jgi:hypothetical protein
MAVQEKGTLAADDAVETMPELKLDRHGLPLVPQPSDRKDDPLVCPNTWFSFIPSLFTTFAPLTIQYRIGPSASSCPSSSKYRF